MPVQIIKGSKAQLIVRLRDVNDDPYDLTGVTEIQTCFQNEDGTETVIKLTTSGIAIIGNPILGKISINLTASNTNLLSTADVGILELAITTSGDPTKLQVPGAYEVDASVC